MQQACQCPRLAAFAEIWSPQRTLLVGGDGIAIDEFLETAHRRMDRRTTALTESTVEDATLSWLEELGYAVLHGPDMAAGEPAGERSDPNAVMCCWKGVYGKHWSR